MNAIREYIRVLREGQNVTQEKLGETIGLSRQAVNEWEKGRTYDMRGSSLIKAIIFLKGRMTDVSLLLNASVEQGYEFAAKRLLTSDIHVIEEEKKFIIETSELLNVDQLIEALELLSNLKQQNKVQEWLRFGYFLQNDSSSYP